MYFNLESLFQRFLNLIITVATLLVAMFALGEKVIFERAVFFILLVCLLLCRRNINNFGVVLAVVIGAITEEVARQLVPYLHHYYLKLLVYGLIGYGFWWFRSDYRNNLTAGVSLLVAVVVESYQFVNGVVGNDLIWHVLLIFNALLVRWMLFMRFTYTEKWFASKVQLNVLEWQIYVLFQIIIYLQVVMIGEYVCRELLNLRINYIFGIYPYLSHLLLIYLVWLILCASSRNNPKNVISA